jgi:hypothetical protein
MRTCKWCNLAQQISDNKVMMCRPCYRRKRKAEALRKERQAQKKAR